MHQNHKKKRYPQKRNRLFPSQGEIYPLELHAVGKLRLLTIETNGIIPSRARHVIRRYLKHVGFADSKVKHENGLNALNLNLVIMGYATRPITTSCLRKIEYLGNSLISLLNATHNGQRIHASQLDTELLREKLAIEEPALRNVYYKETNNFN